eukprot:TRINITY_DN122159_c0_g1_i1.p1 TRINITY_DN122159_c0_g1~~TRINITY_DN122159_c0_g1_i1.p1  ORF type:complete len:224 (+),score=54.64 TRINITY_DN122159_c0_g1_i1:112-783(+)
MSYSKGTLIHNYNEDLYGLDLQEMQRPPQQPYVSVNHAVHGWKQPVYERDRPQPAAATNIDQHLFFGHAGDMRNPFVALQKQEWTTASQYFMQDPRHINQSGLTHGVGTLSADKFQHFDDHRQLHGGTMMRSTLALKKQSSWGDMRQAHALPPQQRFLTETKRGFQPTTTEQLYDATKDKIPRHYGEFTKGYDMVRMARSVAKHRSLGSSGATKSAANLMVHH